MKQKGFFRSCLFLTAFLCFGSCAFSLYAQTVSPVLSPAEGVWANYQSLVLDLPAGAEAFYSLNGEDPVVSGFAYDGPVVLNVSGNVRLLLVTVESSGTVRRFEIPYTVVIKETPSYIRDALERSAASPAKSLNAASSVNGALMDINASCFIDIPQNISYTIGNTGRFFSGRRLGLSEPTVFERYVPLVIYDGELPFRYVLRTGGDAGTAGAEIAGEYTAQTDVKPPIEFIDWNYALFNTQKPLVYSIDGQAVRVSESGKIHIERSKDRSIRWAQGEPKNLRMDDSADFNTFFVPARPELRGEPSHAVVNTAVRLSFSAPDFLFCITAKDGQKRYTPVFIVDVLEGDALGFSQNIDVYYRGVRQGSVRPSFIIDKIPPLPPVFVSSEIDFYARNPLQLTLKSDADVYYYAAPVIKSKTGFSASDIQKINDEAPSVKDEDFVRLSGKNPYLKAGEKDALLYTLYAYSRDTAGNRSDTVRFQTVVDTVNYYAAADGASEAADGSPDKPFADFPSLYGALQKSPASFTRCFMSGSFTGVHALEFNRDTQIIGDGNTRLVFEKGGFLKITDASFSLEHSSLEQHFGGPSDVFQNRLIEAENARLFFSGAELICKDGNSASCIALNNSSLFMEDSGISVEAAVYAEAVSAHASVAELKNLRTLVIAPTALGLKSLRSSAVIEDSSFTLMGKLVRALEFTDSGFTLNSNRFIAENPAAFLESQKLFSGKTGAASAVWSNTPLGGNAALKSNSSSVPPETNIYSGFSSLYSGLTSGGLAPGSL
ncbi:hypothetical protein V1L52_04785 [Treponema sp. HNW]|uniref:hypothetical protein n=1 Tax=Treponema sp. HNW TaxID=3116654 RepID=UPI003D1103A5